MILRHKFGRDDSELRGSTAEQHTRARGTLVLTSNCREPAAPTQNTPHQSEPNNRRLHHTPITTETTDDDKLYVNFIVYCLVESHTAQRFGHICIRKVNTCDKSKRIVSDTKKKSDYYIIFGNVLSDVAPSVALSSRNSRTASSTAPPPRSRGIPMG